MTFKVLIPQDVAEEGKHYLRERGHELVIGSGISIDVLKEQIRDCDALLARTAPYPGEVLRAGKRLKVIGRHGVGVDNIDLRVADELGIVVTNTPEALASSVAEHVLGLIIALARNLVCLDRAVRQGDFAIRTRLFGVDLAGKTLGVMGLGRIGSCVARKAAAGLDMQVLGYDPYVAEESVPVGVRRVDDWEQMLRAADFVTIHLPLNEKTRGLIGAREFKLMKRTAYLVNTARGDIVNEDELVEALRAEEIAGAALDVYEKEPPAEGDPLFGLENVVLTPHNASLTKECMARMSLHAAIGIDEVLSGREPTWPVMYRRETRGSS